MFNEAISPAVAFGAGILSVLSPCILPLLPAVLASSTGKGRLRPLAIVLGVSISFTLMGIVTSAFGAAFQAYTGYLKIVAEILIIAMGLAMLFEIGLFNAFSRFPMLAGMNDKGPVSGLLLGLSLGVLWIPCVGSVLASILTMVALEGSISKGALTLLIYSAGFAVPMLLLAYSAHLSTSKIKLISRYDAVLKKGAGIVLILVGLWMVYQNHFWWLF
ncbi:cytochrome C-type biogenesis protein (ccdA), conjectural [Methanosarcina horonobensis HB-1 = JCM 15518]|uniref:Cytochrome C-type biogenesis protein (CcdA), conjectural n=1 Tax=Methanosarcina horonobensis HB-1 = JCM 15518 TaxID=1434110 RepID=A0A0E3S6N0_9EURY|nr:cytochrome c biogenesis CcdA family protein [Methanosarcina horonobensis]AKB76889.1 cytochrome C-type biogenesis protein (ccdA), conjectural [Methanosarcina horonobensis HB-1 = JCM 15518]